MSKHNNGIRRLFFLGYIIIMSTFLIAMSIGLTYFLVNTLDTPFFNKPELEKKIDMNSILSLTEQVVVRHQGEWTFSEPKLKGHFHHIGRWYQRDTWNFCIDCHGPIPHSKSPQIRAFLNMHSFYTSCLVCHVREHEDKEPTKFTWINLDKGETVSKPSINGNGWGEYGAKIIQLKNISNEKEPLHLDDERSFALEFKRKSGEVSETQKTVANNFIHKRCMEEPVRCTRCHTSQKPFLPYKKLGYSDERTAFLNNPEVVDLVQRYETFLIPNLLTPKQVKPKTP